MSVAPWDMPMGSSDIMRILARIIRITCPPSFTWMQPFHLRVLTGWRGRKVLPAAVQAEETKGRETRQTSKGRRMSTDSASEPPSLAVSYSSYAESMMSASTAPTSAISGHSPPQTQQRAAIDVPVAGPGTEFLEVASARTRTRTLSVAFFAPAFLLVGTCAWSLAFAVPFRPFASAFTIIRWTVIL
ncbi:hypothetical protein EDC04DRAFT_2906672 [Pisolithus marmoratus]|nr:hypothetical protein EDC04DRAFT_2906672 [Pisolithus marmoratus]